MTSIAAALSGGNLIYESSGMTASLLGASFEGFVLDDEMHSNSYRALRGIEVNDATLGFETICEAVLGEGHFLGKSDTYAAMDAIISIQLSQIAMNRAPGQKQVRPARGNEPI